MRNAVVGSLFFMLLIVGLFIGILVDRLELFGFLSLLIGLGIVLLFRKR